MNTQGILDSKDMTVHQGNSVTREEKADTNDEEKEREAGSVGGVLCGFFFSSKDYFQYAQSKKDIMTQITC